MTQKPEKRQTGYTYAVRSYQTDDIYIGSTLGTLRQRLYKHKNDLKRYNNGKFHYVTSYEIVKYDDAFIEMIDKYENVNKIELRKYEGETIRKTENCVNKRIEGQTRCEYYINNKVKIKEYLLINKDKILERKSAKYICECGKELTSNHKSRHNKVCKFNSKAI